MRRVGAQELQAQKDTIMTSTLPTITWLGREVELTSMAGTMADGTKVSVMETAVAEQRQQWLRAVADLTIEIVDAVIFLREGADPEEIAAGLEKALKVFENTPSLP